MAPLEEVHRRDEVVGDEAATAWTRILSRTTYLMVFLLSFEGVVVGSGKPAPPRLTLDELVAVFRTARNSIRSIDVAYRIETIVTPEPKGLVPTDQRTLRCDIVGARYRCTREHQRPGESGLFKTVIAWDGVSEYVYRPEFHEGRLDSKTGFLQEPTSQLNRILSLALLQPPHANGVGLDDWSIESFLRDATLRDMSEVIEGQTCCCVDAYYTTALGDRKRSATLWFDLERPGVVQRIVSYKDDRIMDEWHCLESQQFDAGDVSVWLPIHIKGIGRAFEDRVVTQLISVSAAETRLNPPVHDSDFQITFPPGTRVKDKVSGKEFMVGGEHEEAEGRGVPMPLDSNAQWNGAIFVAVNAVVVLVLAVVLTVRRFRRRH